MGAVYAVGTINADFTMCIAQPVEAGGDLVAAALLRGSGGRGGNVAVAARRLGATARLVGCAVAGPDGAQLVEAPEGIEVADTTGAGDAFAAALAVAVMTGRPPAAAAVDAVAAAAHAVTVVGAQPAMPGRATLDAAAAHLRAAMPR